MSLPKQVEEAAELAEQLHTQMFTQAEPEHEQEEEKPEVEEQEAAADTSNTDPEEDFKHKYEVLKGKYEAEVPRLHQDLRQLKEAVFNRLGEVQQKAPVQEQEVQDPRLEKVAKLREEYGDELVDMYTVLAQIEAEKLLNTRMQPVQQQVEDVQETQVKAAQQNFVEYLNGKVKGEWQGLWSGQDQGFIDFLAKPDPSGLYTYGDLVKAYNDNWDADRLATVFNTYLDSKAPKVEPPVARQPNPAKDAIIAPSRNTQAPSPKAEEKTIWTKEMMAEFQKADRMGKYDSETSKAMWEDLLSAPSENRMR